MKGLLKKDLHMIWAYSKMLLLMVAIFLGVSLLGSESLFLLLYPTIVVAMLPVNLLSYDEKFRWNVYCDAMPVTRRLQVTEKYLLSLLCSGTVFLLLALAHGVRMVSQGQSEEFVQLLGVLLMLSLISPALMMPLIFRMGPERGRLAYFVWFGLFIVLVILLTGRTLVDLPTVSNGTTYLLGSLLLSALLFFGSWRLSIRWYEKREF